VTLALSIIRYPIFAFPEIENPVPIPEPPNEKVVPPVPVLVALALPLTFPFSIIRHPIIEVPS
jgi:hypothetical protein